MHRILSISWGLGSWIRSEQNGSWSEIPVPTNYWIFNKCKTSNFSLFLHLFFLCRNEPFRDYEVFEVFSIISQLKFVFWEQKVCFGWYFCSVDPNILTEPDPDGEIQIVANPKNPYSLPSKREWYLIPRPPSCMNVSYPLDLACSIIRSISCSLFIKAGWTNFLYRRDEPWKKFIFVIYQ